MPNGSGQRMSVMSTSSSGEASMAMRAGNTICLRSTSMIASRMMPWIPPISPTLAAPVNLRSTSGVFTKYTSMPPKKGGFTAAGRITMEKVPLKLISLMPIGTLAAMIWMSMSDDMFKPTSMTMVPSSRFRVRKGPNWGATLPMVTWPNFTAPLRMDGKAASMEGAIFSVTMVEIYASILGHKATTRPFSHCALGSLESITVAAGSGPLFSSTTWLSSSRPELRP
mmetsp:Transcript_79565/g.170589  ORF Transcript_79565/g.170589 Transcript_79565/m.170589 type:complete len:225 (-) Transcript_79565:300-974(-)